MLHNLWSQLKSEASQWRLGAVPGLIVIVAVGTARLTGLLQGLELTALDTLLRFRPPEGVDDRVVIIGITEADIQQAISHPLSDRDIADLLKRLQAYQPAIIGLDIIRDKAFNPGHQELVSLLKTSRNVIGVDVLPNAAGVSVQPPTGLPREQVGFADSIQLDDDGNARRFSLDGEDNQGQLRSSFALLLAQTYLVRQQPSLWPRNGTTDPRALQFGAVELPRFHPNTGAYVRADDSGNQVLLNFRSGRQPFRMFSVADLKAGTIAPDLLRDRIVIVGYTAHSAKDFINSAAIPGVNRGLVNGVEVQAHATSQIVHAVLAGRPMLRTWEDGWEYLWIAAWGFVGIGLGRFLRSPWKGIVVLTIAASGLVGMSYGFLLLGWWVPLVPAHAVLALNGSLVIAALFYNYERVLKSRIYERQQIIEELFTAIHNRPLQTLAKLLRDVQENTLPSNQFVGDLQHLNHELRAVYESARRDALGQGNQLFLSHDRDLDLKAPLHEILYEVYTNTLERDLPCFKTIKVKIIQFEPIICRRLSIEQKRGLCRFLEEALCNVGKHAEQVTRLSVTCAQEGRLQLIRVSDNGVTATEPIERSAKFSGFGTQQANNLARHLGGQFRRYPNLPKGTVCELSWTAKQFWLW